MARKVIFGIPVSPGLVQGRLRLLRRPGSGERRLIAPGEAAAEEAALRRAASQVLAALESTRASMPDTLAEYEEVVAAQMEMARDPRLIESAVARIRQTKICATWALDATVDELCALFRGLDDPYLRDRAQDVRALGLRLQEALAGASRPRAGTPEGILAAEDLSPADVMEMDLGCVLGILTEEGGPTSHTAILARSLHVPALVGVTGLLEAARDGERIIVDGLEGCVTLEPDQADLERCERRKAAYERWERQAEASSHRAAESSDGVRVAVRANLENAAELEHLARSGADGVGLYRTEFAYLGRSMPGEEALMAEYATVMERAAPDLVIFRTLDVGADKGLPAHMALKEPNPALGLRGVRFCLSHEDIFRVQLRALLRAAVDEKTGGTRNAAIMLPMISRAREVRQVRRILAELRHELRARHVPCAGTLPLGVMVETPAAVMIADVLAAECDFFSIGTNDLIHYLMAIDRNNRHVAYLHEPLHPAVVRALKRVADAAHREGIPVSVCGELAADPCGVALLLGMGVDGLSAVPRFVPGIKHMLRKLDAGVCAELVHTVLMTADAVASRRLVLEQLRRFLGPDLSFLTTSLATPSMP